MFGLKELSQTGNWTSSFEISKAMPHKHKYMYKFNLDLSMWQTWYFLNRGACIIAGNELIDSANPINVHVKLSNEEQVDNNWCFIRKSGSNWWSIFSCKLNLLIT